MKLTRIDLRGQETFMGLAQYEILPQGADWGVLHDGDVKNRYATKEVRLRGRSCCGVASHP